MLLMLFAHRPQYGSAYLCCFHATGVSALPSFRSRWLRSRGGVFGLLCCITLGLVTTLGFKLCNNENTYTICTVGDPQGACG